MGQLGKRVEAAHAMASASLANLALMLERGKGSISVIEATATALEKAAITLRTAVKDEGNQHDIREKVARRPPAKNRSA